MSTSHIEELERVSVVLALLSHPRRLAILCCLKDGEKSVSEIQSHCGASQPQTSQFLKQLLEAGYVHTRKHGTFSYYSLIDPKITSLLKHLSDLYCPDLL